MTASSSTGPGFGERRRRRRRAVVLRWVLRLALAAVVFALGVAVGQTLDDNPKPQPARTYVGTLRPLPLPGGSTVTVTVPTK